MSKVKPIPPEIVDYFDYNPETGILTWKKKTSSASRIKIGQKAGTKTSAGGHSKALKYVFIHISFKGIRYLAHRVAYFIYHGVDPKEKQVDHIDGNPLNNKITNLRLATGSQNQFNRSSQKNNKSGVVGVHWDKLRKKWRAYITARGERIYFGYFTDIAEAKAARIAAEKKYFGEYRNDCNEKGLEDLGANNG